MLMIMIYALTVYVVVTLFFKIEGIANGFFSMIWSEQTMNDDVKARLKELYVDSDVPEETGLLIASVEQEMQEEEILRAFSALDANDLSSIIKKNPRDSLSKLISIVEKKRMKNTRR